MSEKLSLDPMVDALREQVDEHKFIDVGANIENDLPVSSGEFDIVLATLEEEGYQVHILRLTHLNDSDQTMIMRVLTGPDVTQEEVFHNCENIHLADFTQQT